MVKTTRDGYVMKWRDAAGTDRQRRCGGKTQRARETERKRLESDLNSRSLELSWNAFWSHIESDHLSDLSRKHRTKCKTMFDRLAAAAKVKGIPDLRCIEICPALILEVETRMRKSGIERATIDSNMASLWSMITWGQDYGLIPEFRRPRKRKGKKSKQTTKAKGRSLAGEEIERLKVAIPACCRSTEPAQPFIDAIDAMRLIGMRLSEVWMFSWEPRDGAHHPVRLHTSNASIEFSSEQKSGKSQQVPLTNEAIEWLRELEKNRDMDTWVCRTRGTRGPHKTCDRLGRVISAAGKLARIVVKRWDKPDGSKIKYASSHDLRRTFATNLHRDLTISERVKMTRHADAQTLLDHYEDAPTPILVAKLRGEF